MHTITLVVGDWSRDAHEKIDEYTINSNVDKKTLKKMIESQKLFEQHKERLRKRLRNS